MGRDGNRTVKQPHCASPDKRLNSMALASDPKGGNHGMENKRVPIFSHIPKTAGTTLRTIINQQYPRAVIYTLRDEIDSIALFRKLPQHNRAKIRVLQGHKPFGIHEYLQVPVDYITMLRQPVDRVISFYCWILRSPGNDLYEKVRSMSLGDFADSRLPQVVNQQIEFVSGLSNNSTAEALNVAKRNLALHFTAFGIAEHFDESLLLFKRLLGWGNIYYASQHVAKNRPAKREIPSATIKLIEKHNFFDMELYEFAKHRLEDVIKKQGQSFWNDVHTFQRMNRIYGKFAEGGS